MNWHGFQVGAFDRILIEAAGEWRIGKHKREAFAQAVEIALVSRSLRHPLSSPKGGGLIKLILADKLSVTASSGYRVLSYTHCRWNLKSLRRIFPRPRQYGGCRGARTGMRMVFRGSVRSRKRHRPDSWCIDAPLRVWPLQHTQVHF